MTAFIHSSAMVDSGATVGASTRIWHWTHVSDGSMIGSGCVLGQGVFIAPGVRIGDRVKIQNNVSVFAGVTLEDDVFCGPSVVFTNVLNPRSFIERKNEFGLTRVCVGASIGANATIVCGVVIGRYALVAAGSVVTKSVPDHALMKGSPARRTGWVSRAGEKLDLIGGRAQCPHGGEWYELVEGVCRAIH